MWRFDVLCCVELSCVGLGCVGLCRVVLLSWFSLCAPLGDVVLISVFVCVRCDVFCFVLHCCGALFALLLPWLLLSCVALYYDVICFVALCCSVVRVAMCGCHFVL